MAVALGAVTVGMLMDIIAVRVRVIVRIGVGNVVVAVAVRMSRHGPSGMRPRGLPDHPAKAGQRQQAEQDEHDPDGELHGEAHARRNHHAEQDDRAADDQDRERMPDAPGAADQRRAAQRALTADDRGDGDHVVGIGGVAHAEEEAQEEERRQIGDRVRHLASSPRRAAVAHVPGRGQPT